MTTEKITTVLEGQKVVTQAGVTFKVTPPCKELQGCWYCVTCKVLFESDNDKDDHIRSGKHRLAWFCLKHGFEVPSDKKCSCEGIKS